MKTYQIPAGNSFLNNGVSNVYNALDQVTYYSHSGENLLSYSGISKIDIPTENECPSRFYSPYKSAMVQTEKGTADSLKFVLDALIDDGDTQSLTNEVILADYSEAVELYYDLIEVSPNLSEVVMLEAINKEFTLPSALLTLILQSNPHAAKSSRIQTELDQRSLPLEIYQREMIDEGLDLVFSYKENLEARRSYHEGKYHALLNLILFEIIEDTLILDKVSAIEAVISGYETVDHYYLIIDLLIMEKRIAEAQSKLTEIATDFNLDPRRDDEYSDFIDVYTIWFDKVLTGDTILTQQELNTLGIIAYRNFTLADGLAKVLLYNYASIPIHEPLVKPEISTTPKSNSKSSKVPESKVFKIYPNPTRGIVLIEIPTTYEKVNVTVIDIYGKIVYKEQCQSGEALINLRDLSTGSYIVRLDDKDGNMKESHQIQIVR